MSPAEVLGLVTPSLALAGVGVAAVVKLTRITDSLDRLNRSMEKVLEQTDQLDTRVTRLEVISGGRHARTPKKPDRW